MGWKPAVVFDRTVDILFRELRKRGHGSIDDADLKIGQQRGYLRSVCRKGRRSLRYGKLLEVLHFLGIHPLRFFEMGFGEAGADAVPANAKPPATGDPVAAFGVQATSFRWKGEAGKLARTLERLACRRPFPPLEEAELARLEEMDALRYEDHQAAATQARRLAAAALARGHFELALRAAGVLASSLRLSVDLDGAQAIAWGAFRAARRHGCQATAADLLQRMVYIAADRGDHRMGLRLGSRAMEIYIDLEDPVRVRKAQVERGIMMIRLERYESALQALRTALQYLPEGERRYRFSAMHGIASSYLGLGDIPNAEAILRLAEPELPPGPHHRGRLFWLQAAMASYSENIRGAETLYRRALDIFDASLPADRAICSIELIHLLLRAGRPLEAHGLARGIQAVAFMLPQGSVVDAAVFELLNTRRITAKVVHQTLEQIGQASFLIMLEKIDQRRAAGTG